MTGTGVGPELIRLDGVNASYDHHLVLEDVRAEHAVEALRRKRQRHDFEVVDDVGADSRRHVE